MSLLDTAKEVKVGHKFEFTNETLELALAWCNGEITNAQVEKVMASPTATRLNVYSFIAQVLRHGVQHDRLTITLVGSGRD